MSSKNSDLLRVVGIADVPTYAGFQLQMAANGTVIAAKAPQQRFKAPASAAATPLSEALAAAVNDDAVAMHVLAPVSAFVGSVNLALSHAARDLRRRQPRPYVVALGGSTNDDREKRTARIFHEADGALLQRPVAELSSAAVEQLASGADPVEDFVVAHAHAPLGSAVDGSSLACFVSRYGSAYVVDAGAVVYDAREALATATIAARHKRRAVPANNGHAAGGDAGPVPSFLEERDEVLVTAAAWSTDLRLAGAPLLLFVGTRSGRVAALRFERSPAGDVYRLDAPDVAPTEVTHRRCAITALAVSSSGKQLVIGAFDGSVVAVDFGASGARPDARPSELLSASPLRGAAVLSLYEHPRLGLFAARGNMVVSLQHEQLRWRAHDTTLTGLSGGTPYGQPALVTCAHDGTVHFWPLASTRAPPTVCVLRQSCSSPALGCVLDGNSIVVLVVCPHTTTVSFALLRDTGRLAVLAAPWSHVRGARLPEIDFARLEPTWGNVYPLLNAALFDSALTAARAFADIDTRGVLHAFLSLASVARPELAPLLIRTRRAALRAHAHQVLSACGNELSAHAQAMFSFAPATIKCRLCKAQATRIADADVATAEDELQLVCAAGHANRCDARTMAPLVPATHSDSTFCPACRVTHLGASADATAALIQRKLPQLFANVGGTKATPRCVYCRLPTLVRTDATPPMLFMTIDDFVK